jgi:predicted flavoprotein YhiN
VRRDGRTAGTLRAGSRKNPPAGEKILISGGGRCNFTNLYTEPGCFISAKAGQRSSELKSSYKAEMLENK